VPGKDKPFPFTNRRRVDLPVCSTSPEHLADCTHLCRGHRALANDVAPRRCVKGDAQPSETSLLACIMGRTGQLKTREVLNWPCLLGQLALVLGNAGCLPSWPIQSAPSEDGPRLERSKTGDGRPPRPSGDGDGVDCATAGSSGLAGWRGAKHVGRRQGKRLIAERGISRFGVCEGASGWLVAGVLLAVHCADSL
jgi:hypothetical protein